MATIAEAVATGDLAPCEAVSMAKVVETYIHALQAKAFDERLAKVETLAANNANLPDYGEGILVPTQPSAEKSFLLFTMSPIPLPEWLHPARPNPDP
jgi:hypothetical protein